MLASRSPITWHFGLITAGPRSARGRLDTQFGDSTAILHNAKTQRYTTRKSLEMAVER